MYVLTNVSGICGGVRVGKFRQVVIYILDFKSVDKTDFML